MFDYKGKTIYLGIDVHKNSYSVAAVCDNTVIKKDKLLALPQGLVDYCNHFFKGAKIKSAYEAGFSGFHLHRFLIKNNIENIVVHAASIEVSSRDFVKTDKRDALKIATQLSSNRLRAIHIPSEEREDKRHLTRLRETLIRQKVRVGCQLKSLLHLYNLKPDTKTERLTKNWVCSLKKLKVPRNLEYRLHRQSKLWLYLDYELSQVEKKIREEMVTDYELKSIYSSVPGIGEKASNILINELGDTLQFSNENKLYSHCGLTPTEHSSGEHKKQGHITHQGKPIIRRILVQAAWKAVKKDMSLNSIFERISQKRGKKRAIIAIARILIGRVRSCIKRRGLYLIEVPKKQNEPPVITEGQRAVI